jgi:hypothetical protein
MSLPPLGYDQKLHKRPGGIAAATNRIESS